MTERERDQSILLERIKAELTYPMAGGLGPRPLPRPQVCPTGHAVTWITNREAVCLDSSDLACIWRLVIPGSLGPYRLETILNVEARSFAYAIKTRAYGATRSRTGLAAPPSRSCDLGLILQ